MTRLLRGTAVLAATMLLAAPAAAGPNTFHLTSTSATVVDIVGDMPNEIPQLAARCPEGWVERLGLLLSSQGTVDVVTPEYTGPATFTDSHCSVPQPPAHTWFTPLYPDAQRKVTPIDIEAGLMTVVTPVGEVHLSYKAPGVIHGDLFGQNTHTFHGPYTVTGGTGEFAGATGHGNLSGVAVPSGTTYTIDLEMHGTLVPTG